MTNDGHELSQNVISCIIQVSINAYDSTTF